MNDVHSYLFAAVPPIAWVVSGCLKFAVNSVRHGKEARKHIGNGGFPSTHTSVVSSIAATIGFTAGWDSPLFGLAVAALMIVMIDATGVRRAVGENSRWINDISRRHPGGAHSNLREKQGHSKIEIAGGLGVGTLVGWLASLLV
ncbi:divergent PAP2 family protein [Paenibacillus sp. GYB003]|uniref:divergent PAP2 family protein n=1 Tax=Paenibacillus sp. GYB003 TaxID=2994392 RepID=UPI002F96BECB